jgi:hypothetical protein
MKLGVLALGCLLVVAPAAAQEKADGKAVSIDFVKFKPNTVDRIDEIERKYFDPAAEKFGFRPTVIRFATGEWDREYIFPMPGGMADLGYKTTKEQIAWMAEVDRLAGGPGMGKKLLAEWDAAVERRSTDIGFSDAK